VSVPNCPPRNLRMDLGFTAPVAGCAAVRDSAAVYDGDCRIGGLGMAEK
jgi:hypothetical protein